MKVTFFLYSFMFACICHAAPLEKVIDEDPEDPPRFFEGDIILDDSNRNGLHAPADRWPNNTIFYYINNEFDEEHRNYIERAMRTIEAVSCIRFTAVSPNSKYYVNITGTRNPCYGEVGFKNKVQNLNLSNDPLDEGCFSITEILHGLLHTIGFYHMQNTHNRDEYVRIVNKYIKEGSLDYFDRYNANVVSNYGQGYDYFSVMHRDEYFLSKNDKRTIIPLQLVAPEVIGHSLELSQKDINKINIMYDCPVRA